MRASEQAAKVRTVFKSFFRSHINPRVFGGGAELRVFEKPIPSEQLERFHHPGFEEAALYPVGDGRVALLFQMRNRDVGLRARVTKRLDLSFFQIRLFHEGNYFRAAFVARHHDFMAHLLEELERVVGAAQMKWHTPMLNVAPIFPRVVTKRDGRFSHLAMDTYLVRLTVKPFDIVQEAEAVGREEHLRQIAREITLKYFGEAPPEEPELPFQDEILDGLYFGTQIQARLSPFFQELKARFGIKQ